MKKRWLGMSLACALALAAFTGCSWQEVQDKVLTGTSTESSAKKDDFSMDEVEDKVEEIQKLIEENFYFSTEEKELDEGIYKGLMESLDDPYSVYYTKEEFADLMEETSGEYVGIGVQVSQNPDTKVITVTRVFPGSPAEEAGVLKGDKVAGVDDFKFNGEDVSDVVDLIRGEEGTTVEFKVYRESVADYVTMTVTRRKVENPTVSYEMLDDGIGYVQVTEFYDVTAKQYIAALEDMEAQGMKALVVDLRDNPGGLLSAVGDMLDYMLPEGMLVYTKDKNDMMTGKLESTNNHVFEKPVVVLVNGNSASASEIYAGAMQDRGAAKLVGTKTFGKGIVQRLFDLKDGSGVKITISKYFTPNGNDIHGVGISPDYEVELPAELRTKSVLEHAEDVQLQKGIEVLKSQIGQ